MRAFPFCAALRTARNHEPKHGCQVRFPSGAAVGRLRLCRRGLRRWRRLLPSRSRAACRCAGAGPRRQAEELSGVRKRRNGQVFGPVAISAFAAAKPRDQQEEACWESELLKRRVVLRKGVGDEGYQRGRVRISPVLLRETTIR